MPTVVERHSSPNERAPMLERWIQAWGCPVATTSADYEREQAKGRIALWLDPDDLKFLACEYSRLPDETPTEAKHLWMRIAARAHAALQKSGNEPPPFVPAAGTGDPE